MSVIFQRNRVAGYLAECEEYWYLRGVPGRRIALMKAEMEPSIQEAAQSGLPLEDVFGPAQEWAECQYKIYRKEIAHAQVRDHRMRRMLFLFLLVGSLALFPQHFLHSTLSFPLTIADVAIIAFIAISVEATLLPVWKRLIFSRPDRENGSRRRRSKGRGIFSSRYFWWVLAGALASQVVPLRAIGEASSGFVVWSWLHTLVLVSATAIVGLIFHRLDPARPVAHDCDVEEALAPQPNSRADWEEKRRSDRLHIASTSISVLCLGYGWLLFPAGAREIGGLCLTLSLYWLLYMSYLYLLEGRAGSHSTASSHV